MFDSRAGRLLKAAGVAGILWCGATAAAQAGTVFSEDFSGSTPGSYGIGALPGTQFAVTSGDADVLGVLNGSFFGCGGNPAGNCVDTVGSSGHGTIASTVGIDLHAGGTYTISYTDLLQGPPAGTTPTATYSVSLGSHVFAPISMPTVQLQSFTFTAATDELGALLSFIVASSIDAVHGPVISGISVTETLATATTPIPATLPLLASALGGLGFAGWRRKQRAA